jgi:hypothetical protein
MPQNDGVIFWDDVLATAVLEAYESKLDPVGLENIPEKVRELILNESNLVVKFEIWGDYCFDGRRYYAAHKAALAVTPSAGQGTIGSESVGSVSVSSTLAVNNPSPQEGILETHFGRQYYQLQRIVVSQLIKYA